jgi:hypothetical protein
MKLSNKPLHYVLPILPILITVPLSRQSNVLPAAVAAPAKNAQIKAKPASWRSVLYGHDWNPASKRFDRDKLIQDFSYAGYHRGEKPIPKISGPLFNVVTAYGADPTGVKDSTVAIQNAINAASEVGGVVYLPAGTFRVKPPEGKFSALRIMRKMVLRGAGKDRTFLFNDDYNMRRKNIITVQESTAPVASTPGVSTNIPAASPGVKITRDLLSPTMTIPVANVAGFARDDWVELRTDVSEPFVAEHNMGDYWGGKGNALGGVLFQRQITAVNAAAKTLTIDIPIRYYLKTRDRARVIKTQPSIEEVGLEDLSIGNREHPGTTGWEEPDYDVAGKSSYDVHVCYAVVFNRARNCWITNIATYRPTVNTGQVHILSDGVGLNNCRSITVANCDFQRPQYGGAGGNGYMYRLTNTQETLLENCAARYQRHGFVFSSMGTSGNVIHGGITEHTAIQASGSGKTMGRGSDHHQHLSQSNLIDGVTANQDLFTAHYRGFNGNVHGQTSVHVVYWNLNGLAYYGTSNYFVLSEQARYGYVIGTRGPASGIKLSTKYRMLPVDHAEGIGQGDRLEPQSLYLDQRRRRLGH